ncbi:abortive infection protein [Leptotrichia sp. oral taxon 212]|uniref:type IV toxin-antitoxin system AbiEi family antitoxin domain-containing protein n=1 Tax=Leptotrichia sp. oral taxon 212 TaxID=712357 RepID=UPI0006BD77D8|nr:abortive infection protein [Leptotrichia sp. oral taxon 212]ALA95629.1 abortive infection protein [Leptotrichia sp. oral taxon 212]
MEIRKRELLIRKIKENNGIITTKEVINLGIHKDVLKELTIKKELEKITNGLYALPSENIDEYLYFSYRIPKGIFSHETAAYLQGLSTRMPLVYLMTVKVGDNVSRVKSVRDNIIFKYVKKDYYDIGKINMVSPFGREISVYDKERTILDIIKDKDRIDVQVFSEVIKSYFASKEKNLLKLSKYAIMMNMEYALKQYSEMLQNTGTDKRSD